MESLVLLLFVISMCKRAIPDLTLQEQRLEREADARRKVQAAASEFRGLRVHKASRALVCFLFLSWLSRCKPDAKKKGFGVEKFRE